jgi:hypothetical protein
MVLKIDDLKNANILISYACINKNENLLKIITD